MEVRFVHHTFAVGNCNEKMKNILGLNAEKARGFLLKQESYVKFDLPIYYSFQDLINQLDKQLSGKKLSDFCESSPRDYDDVNYRLLTNKDGKYAWRPFQLINPALYVSLVHCITEKDNWKMIQNRFQTFQDYERIECHSIPIVSDSENKTDQESQIFTWWQMIEQNSIALSLDYRYLLQTDISDCYSSSYTHSIPWAIHGKKEAKKKENRNKQSLIGVAIDTHLQDMSFGQTNGIPQGSVLMDLIAEMVLGYVDQLLSEKLLKLKIADYHILRYRDDYRIFTNNTFESDQIMKVLSEILSDMGLKLNAGKTEVSDDVIKSSIKPDKRYWIANKRITKNKQKWLIQLHLLSEMFPNSGTLDMQMREFLVVLKGSKKDDTNIETLVSLVTEIGFRNPRVYPTIVAILSLLINQMKDDSKKKSTINRIHNKFQQIPNSSLLMVWLQRLYLKLDESIEYDETLCKKVLKDDTQIWNVEWLNSKLKKLISQTPIIVTAKVDKLKDVVSKKEIKRIVTKRAYSY